jgi:hypothetical protein
MMQFSLIVRLAVVKSRRAVRFNLERVKVREVAGQAGEVRRVHRGGERAPEAGDGGVELGLARARDGEARAAEFETGFGDGVADSCEKRGVWLAMAMTIGV